MQIVPVSDAYSQTLNVTLGGQSCRIVIRRVSTGLFLDLYVSNVAMITGVICQDRNRIVRDVYRGFIGDLAWLDTQGSSDPSSPGLGTRYLLAYLTAGDLAASSIA